MILRKIAKQLPNILTVVAGVGVIVTVKLAIDAHDKCVVDQLRLFDIPKESKPEERIANKKKAIKHYMPTILVGAATITSIIGIRVLDIRTEKNLLAAAMYSQTMLAKYEYKLNKVAGEKYAGEIRADICNEIQAGLIEDIHENYGSYKMPCYDPYSDTYFKASQVDLLLAEGEINKCVANGGGMSLVDYMKFFDVDISDKYPNDPKEIPGWYCDDDYCYNSSYYGYFIQLLPMITDIKWCGETMVINCTHEPVTPSEDFLYG